MERQEQENHALVPAQSQALQKAPPPGYWARVCNAYKTASHAFFVALPIFIVVFMLTCPRAFNYDSLFGFTRDLRSAASFASSDYQSFTYTYSEGDCKMLPYRGGLAVVNREGIEVYAPGGERTLDVTLPMKEPRATASRKYLLAYDYGSTSFTVTNAYSRLHWGDTVYPIYLAEMSESGRFAFVTGAKDHLSQVLLYDANFNLIQRFNRASAVVSLAISDNGRYVAFCGLSSEGGVPACVVELYRIGAKNATFSQRFEGELPTSVQFMDNRYLALITDGATRVMDLEGDVKNEQDLSASALLRTSFAESGCALLLEEDALHATSRLVICDRRGALRCEASVTGEVRAMALTQNHVFLLQDGAVLRISLADMREERIACDPGALDIQAVDEARVRVTYSAQAIYLNFTVS